MLAAEVKDIHLLQILRSFKKGWKMRGEEKKKANTFLNWLPPPLFF